jgi:hypothetical protein
MVDIVAAVLADELLAVGPTCTERSARVLCGSRARSQRR